MARGLRTISIDFKFKNPSVVFEASFSTSLALFDFDVVVVRPYSFLRGKSISRTGGSIRVEWEILSRAKSEITNKIEDLNRLLRQGGLLIVILDVVEILQFQNESYFSEHEIHSVTNYDFLDSQFFMSVRNGKGDRLEYLDLSDPFAKTIKSSTVQWTAYISGRPNYPFNNMNIFARNGSGSFVGASMESGAGHIIFLPNLTDLNEGEFFEACKEYRFGREGTPPPDWVSSVFLPGQAQADMEISEVEQQIGKLEESRKLKLQRRDELLFYKKLLFEKGKHQLEPIVRKALDALEFQTSPGENIPGTQFEIDGRTRNGSAQGILEIKGSKNQVSLDEFSPFVIKLLADFNSKGIHSKGIFIANGRCLESPQERLGEAIFSPHVLEAARTHSVALVNSVELYCVICELLNGEACDLPAMRERILIANGYANLTSFLKKVPFSPS
jgi:hypothetical protein